MIATFLRSGLATSGWPEEDESSSTDKGIHPVYRSQSNSRPSQNKCNRENTKSRRKPLFFVFSRFGGCVLRTQAILEKRMNSREERETEHVKHRREDEGGHKDRARSQTGQPDEEGEQHGTVPPKSFVLAGRERQPQVRRHEPTVRRATSPPDKWHGHDKQQRGQAVQRVVRRQAVARKIRVRVREQAVGESRDACGRRAAGIVAPSADRGRPLERIPAEVIDVKGVRPDAAGNQ